MYSNRVLLYRAGKHQAIFPQGMSWTTCSRLLLTQLRNTSITSNYIITLSPRSASSLRFFSSLDGTKAEGETDPVSNRIARTVYRQLLRWCQTTGINVPLTNMIPPVHMEPPDIDPFRLELLAHGPSEMDDRFVQRARNLLPPQTRVKPNQLTLLAQNTGDLKKFIQSVFRLNYGTTQQELVKRRQSEAFSAVRSLNELSARLHAIEVERQNHSDREGVQFCIGQVVRHRDERWRGVISDWNRPYGNIASSPALKSSSLTTKDYSQVAGTSRTVVYNVILDVGDAHAMGSPSGWTPAAQRDLEVVDDEDLIRIRSAHLAEKFVRFDAKSRLFVPTDLHAYSYPQDQPDASMKADLPEEVQQICFDIVGGVQAFATRLKRCILDESSCPAERKLTVLANALDRLELVVAGDVLTPADKLAGDKGSPLKLAACHLRELHSIQQEICDSNHKRHSSKQAKDRVKFELGDIVKHSVFGFRGVVVGWDPRPSVNLKHWDGLKDIKNPEEYPFYHVIPDPNDCIKAFGAPRSMRYVCEANMELCPADYLDNLVVDLDPTWVRMSPEKFKPPRPVSYEHGSTSEDDVVTERCLLRIQDEYNSWHLNARLAETEDNIVQKLSMKAIGKLLKYVDTQTNAHPVQEILKEMRKAHPNREVRWQLDLAMTRLLGGDGNGALDVLENIVREDPNYAEGWNKLATCQFMFGRYKDSLETTKKVLELDPQNTQALNGMGLIYFEEGEYKEAATAFRKSMSLDPWSPVSTKLSLTMDLLNREIYREELQ